jgi:hypothetical protein
MWITVGTPSFTGSTPFDRIVDQVGGIPAGRLARYIGTAEHGSLRGSCRGRPGSSPSGSYVQRLGPAFARVMGEPARRPNVDGVAVERNYTPQPAM